MKTKLLIKNLHKDVEEIYDICKILGFEIYINSNSISIKTKKDTYTISIIRDYGKLIWNIECKNSFKIIYEDTSLSNVLNRIILKEQ